MDYKQQEFEKHSELFRALSKSRKLQLLSIIKKNPGLTGSELISKFHIEPTTVYMHLQGLKKNKLVEYKRVGRRCHYYYNDDIEEVLKKSLLMAMELNGAEK